MFYGLKSLIYVGRHTPTDAEFSIIEADNFEQACEKVLKHGKDHNLIYDDIKHYTNFSGKKEMSFKVVQPENENSTLQIAVTGIVTDKEINVIK